MRLSADAKAYGAGAVSQLSSEDLETSGIGPAFQELLATAFQAGYDHHKASQRRLEKLAKGGKG